MKDGLLSRRRAQALLASARKTRVLVLGDVMLDQFIWGAVRRISPEAPVPVVEFEAESYMPGGAGNVARNLTAVGVRTELVGVTGDDQAAKELRGLLDACGIGCSGLLVDKARRTSLKTRIVAHQQQVVRIDRETRQAVEGDLQSRLLRAVESKLGSVAAVIVGDYGKGVVTQPLLEEVRALCRPRGIWLSVDPKPRPGLTMSGMSLITPNRKEAFELAGLADETKDANPLRDRGLLRVVEVLLESLRPAILLITLGEQGMLLCHHGSDPVHIPTIAQEVFDVSGAGDTVIASFTLAVAGGASPLEAAVLSNHAAGIVVGKVGTATVTPEELLASFER
jgi:D-beta-D-heptose 7-phosphate kinase/D-beta-D-heptose 1-phosphate adenosyltransferase